MYCFISEKYISVKHFLFWILFKSFSNRPPPSKGSQLPLPSNLLDPEISQQCVLAGRKRKHSDSAEGGMKVLFILLFKHYT